MNVCLLKEELKLFGPASFRVFFFFFKIPIHMNRALQFNLTYLLCTNMMGSDSQGSLAPGVGRQTRSLVCYRSWHGLPAPTGSSEGTETAMASPASPLGSGVQVL